MRKTGFVVGGCVSLMALSAGWLILQAAQPIRMRMKDETVREQVVSGFSARNFLEQFFGLDWSFLTDSSLLDDVSSSFEPDTRTEQFTGPYAVPAGTDPVELDETDENLYRMIDFDALQEMNPDAAYWLWIPGTGIDSYVMQEPEVGLSRYIDHDIDLYESEAGCFFMMKVPDGYEDRNPLQVVMGHRMTSRFGEWAFSNLPFYYNQESKGYDYVYFYSKGRTERWKLWAAADVSEDDSIYVLPYIRETEEYLQMIRSFERQAFYVKESVNDSQDLRMLSTCTLLPDGTTGRFAAGFVLDAVVENGVYQKMR